MPLLGLSLIFEGSARWQSAASSIDASGIAALGYVVVVSTFFGYGVWYRLMSRHPASTVAPFTLLGDRNWWAPAPLRRLYDRYGLKEAPSVAEVTVPDQRLAPELATAGAE